MVYELSTMLLCINISTRFVVPIITYFLLPSIGDGLGQVIISVGWVGSKNLGWFGFQKNGSTFIAGCMSLLPPSSGTYGQTDRWTDTRSFEDVYRIL